jgi:hypothetical protein
MTQKRYIVRIALKPTLPRPNLTVRSSLWGATLAGLRGTGRWGGDAIRDARSRGLLRAEDAHAVAGCNGEEWYLRRARTRLCMCYVAVLSRVQTVLRPASCGLPPVPAVLVVQMVRPASSAK